LFRIGSWRGWRKNKSVPFFAEALVNLNDLGLESGMPDDDANSIIDKVAAELTKAGYQVTNDDITALHIAF
jgi:hypothetical protein